MNKFKIAIRKTFIYVNAIIGMNLIASIIAQDIDRILAILFLILNIICLFIDFPKLKIDS